MITATRTHLPTEQALDDVDGRYLRKAIYWSHAAARRGNKPFGALVVSARGEVLAEAHNDAMETGDCTGHAEMNAIRALAGRHHGRETLAGATLYASAEPCTMCAGAILWANIGRVVFGIDIGRLDAFREPVQAVRRDRQEAPLSCRDVFRTAPQAIDCVGPALVDEASAPHESAWNT